MEILFLPVHICISTCFKIQKFRRYHRTSCDDSGMVAKGNQAESRYSICEGRFSGDSAGGWPEDPGIPLDKYKNLYKLDKNSNFLDIKNEFGV